MNCLNLWRNVTFIAAIALVIISSLFVTGCAGVCIVDVASSSVIVRRDDGTFREEPIYLKESSFVTLGRTETNTFVCKEYSFAGKEIGRTYMPLLFTGYGGDEYAFSPDGRHVAYMESFNACQNHRLRIFSISEEGTKLLPTGPSLYNNSLTSHRHGTDGIQEQCPSKLLGF